MPNKFVDTMNHVMGVRGFDYDEISDQVFIGTNMCCQYGFDKELLDKNVRADISLEYKKVDAPKGVDYFLWLPTIDQRAPTQDKLTLGVQTLEFFLTRNIKVYIHCKNGHGRAPTLYAAYLIKNGMSTKQAIAFLKSKRSGVHITKSQIAALEIFKKGFKKG